MNTPEKNSQTGLVVGIVVAVVACLCLCLAALAATGYAFFQSTAAFATQISNYPTPDEFPTPFDLETPTPEDRPTPSVNLTVVPTPVANSGETLNALEAEIIPVSNLREIATRLLGIPDIPEVVNAESPDYPVGTTLSFFVDNSDTDATFSVDATLLYKTENVYFFSENGVTVDDAALRELVDNFQNEIYPTDREFFGSEWNPGVDNDPHLYILFVRGLGSSLLGYYKSADEYSHLAQDRSNEKEIFYINADNTGPGDNTLPSTLAHEFQHMIHWYHDANEETWMNEGSSVLAEFLNGYTGDGFDYAFTSKPDLQLNSWSYDPSSDPDVFGHYGAGFLFMTYFLDRFGHESTQALVADPNNGMRAVDAVLTAEGLTDPITGAPITSDDVFADWVIANYLGDDSVGDGRYVYHNYPVAPTVDFPEDTFNQCPGEVASDVHQFATDYYELDCGGQVTLTFQGSQQVQVVGTEPNSGSNFFWGHRNDESDTSLTRAFDLTGLDAATLTFNTWFELEENWDYVYLLVSTDDGATWDMVQTPSGTDTDPVGNNLGWGYTGFSGGGNSGEWIEESIDLTPYVGQPVLIRFEYVTDAAVNLPGFVLDDIRLDAVGYSTDFETDEGGWDGQGFVRMDNLLAQEFIIQIIHQDGATTVERVQLDASNHLTMDLDLSDGPAILVISGVTPFTTELAPYQFAVTQN